MMTLTLPQAIVGAALILGLSLIVAVRVYVAAAYEDEEDEPSKDPQE